MQNSKDEWIITADLARLKLDQDEAEKLAEEAEKMRQLFLSMSQADVDNLEPTTHAFAQRNRVRKDQQNNFDHIDQLIEAAPETEDDFFLIPNVL